MIDYVVIFSVVARGVRVGVLQELAIIFCLTSLIFSWRQTYTKYIQFYRRMFSLHLAGKHFAVLALELRCGHVGGEESLLLEEFHDQLPPAVQSLPE